MDKALQPTVLKRRIDLLDEALRTVLEQHESLKDKVKSWKPKAKAKKKKED